MLCNSCKRQKYYIYDDIIKSASISRETILLKG
jgi:hypothetical protein